MDHVVKLTAAEMGTNPWKKLMAELGMPQDYNQYDEVHLHVKDVEFFYNP